MRKSLLLTGSLLTASLLTAAILTGAGAAHAGGGHACQDPPSKAAVATARLSMASSCFRPALITVTTGETVEVVNDDPVLHNLHGPGWSVGNLPPGGSEQRTFSAPGIYTFACTLHPAMTGAVVVGAPEPIAAVSPADDGDRASAVLLVVAALAIITGVGGGWVLGRSSRALNLAAEPQEGATPGSRGPHGVQR